MKNVKMLCILPILLFTFHIGYCQEEKITDIFFKQYSKNPVKAYGDLFTDNKWMKDKKSSIETNKINLSDFLNDLGTYYGFELITEKKAGESYILKSFLVKYERQPIRFTFILYKPLNSWQIQNFTYDAEIDEELKESAKAYRLKYNW